jgi:hypothetical protein
VSWATTCSTPRCGDEIDGSTPSTQRVSQGRSYWPKKCLRPTCMPQWPRNNGSGQWPTGSTWPIPILMCMCLRELYTPSVRVIKARATHATDWLSVFWYVSYSILWFYNLYYDGMYHDFIILPPIHITFC